MISRVLISSLFIIGTAQAAAPKLTLVARAGENINGKDLSSPISLAVSPEGDEFLVADALNDRVVIFDTSGQSIHTFPLGDNRSGALGIAVGWDHEIYVGSMNLSQIWIYDFSGNYLRTLELPDKVIPGRMVPGDDGSIYLIDRLNKNIMRIDKFGNPAEIVSLPGEDCQQPSGIILDKADDILVISSLGDVVTKMSPNGALAAKFGKHGRRRHDFSFPTSGDIDTAGNIWIVDSFRHLLSRYDTNGQFQDTFGVQGEGPGEFYFPIDIKITTTGKLAVLDKGAGRLQIFAISYEE